MADADIPADELEAPAAGGVAAGFGWWIKRGLIALALIAILIVAALWLSRERIAGNIIDDALNEAGLEAGYEIEQIGPSQQVIRNLVIGDPRSPDVTIDRVIVETNVSFAGGGIGQITLERPRVFGTFADGALSLGALDPFIYAESDEPEGLPEYDIRIIDGRARIDSDYGVIGVKLDGEGRLDDGFEGTLAATAPDAGIEGCRAATATLYGTVSTEAGDTNFEGPVRLAQLECAGAIARSADFGTTLSLNEDFSSLNGVVVPDAKGIGYAGATIAQVGGNAQIVLPLSGERAGNLNLRHDLDAAGLEALGASLQTLNLNGDLRASNSFASLDWELDAQGEGVDLAFDEGGALASARQSAAGTLAEGLLAKLESGLARALTGGTLSANPTIRVNEDATNIIVPEARLRSGAGDTILALSRVSYTSIGNRVVGNILTGGPDLPQITGRMDQVLGGDLTLRLTMQEYSAGSDRLSIPRMRITQTPRGRINFDGLVKASGALPGGALSGLEVPLEGKYDPRGGLAVGTKCTPVKVRALRYFNLALDARSVTLCPEAGGAIARYTDTFTLAAQTQALTLSGTIGGSVTQVKADSAMLRYPGPIVVEGLEATIGSPGSAVRLSAESLDGSLGDTIGGTFSGGSALLDVVAFDLNDIAGNWSFDNNVLSIGEGQFTLSERIDPEIGGPARFYPLQSQGATFSLEGGKIDAEASLFHPGTGTPVTKVDIDHDLTAQAGEAIIDVPGLTFTPRFQPEDLTYLAEGVILLADGTITGDGLVKWNADQALPTSTGTFRTDGFDFAAAFGPVRGVKGEIEFSDLINLTTKPSQVLTIESVNPGIEALEGRIVYSLTDAQTITIEDGRWPFMGGELILRPTTATYGSEGGQNYVFELIALDAATFVTQMEMSNIGATGTFDGTIPIFFDPNGNGFIRGGLLIARPPGGNVAYVGELTYEDLGFMGNYAFQTLRSLDYNQMSIGLNGSLAGEILTNFQIDGIRQGEGASQNFITREIAKLPIRFKINVRSENFYTLGRIVRGLFDPTAFGDPVEQGILSIENGQIIRRSPLGVAPPDPSQDSPADAPPEAPEANLPSEIQRRDEPAVQPPESDDLP